MTIKVTKTQTVEEEREITLPYFCKHCGYSLALYEENYMIVVFGSEYCPSVSRGSTWIYKTELSQGEEITEEEFDNAFNQAMNQLKQYQKEAV